MSIIDELAKKQSIYRLINSEKSKDYPTPYYAPVSGEFLGWHESDDHFRKRIKRVMGVKDE